VSGHVAQTKEKESHMNWFEFFFPPVMPVIGRSHPCGDGEACSSMGADSHGAAVGGKRALRGASPLRSASLESRANKPLIGPFARRVPLVLYLTGVAACAVALCLRGIPQGRSAIQHLWLPLLFLVLALWSLWIVAKIQWFLPMEPEPLDPSGSRELREAWGDLKRTKARGLYLSNLIFEVTFLTTAFLRLTGIFAGRSLGPTIGVLGAVLGTLFGIAGGLFGTLMTLRARRIHRLVEELSER